MKTTAVQPELAEPDHAADELSPRAFRAILLLTALVGLVIRVYVGRKTFISFDEWQHVFIAASPRWTDLAFELKSNAHPPLFFLLLRGIVRLGNIAPYRFISVAAGAGSIVVVGLIARRILNSAVLQLLCAAVFALSADAISVSVEIRSYQLAVFLALLAFLFWLAMFPDGDGTVRARTCIAFAMCSSLAVLSDYSVAFFLGACLAVSPLRSARWTRKSTLPVVSALAFPCAVFAVEYFVHAGAQPIQGYLYAYYWRATPNETAASFVLRNSRNFFNLFSPLELRSAAAFLPVALLLCVATAWALFGRLRSRRVADRTASLAIVFAIVTILELLAASLLQKYPFGGLLRHQYIAGPFLLIAAFVVLDTLVPLAGPPLRRAIPAFLLAACIANLIVEGPKLIVYPGVVLLQKEFDSWNSAFPQARAVYLDHWAVIGYFIHTSKRPRVFVRRIADNAVIDQYHVPGGTPAGTETFYDKTRDTLDLSDGTVYRSIAACLRDSGVKELALFFFSPAGTPFGGTPRSMESMIIQKAAEQGLATTKVVVGRTWLSAGFRLR